MLIFIILTYQYVSNYLEYNEILYFFVFNMNKVWANMYKYLYY